MALTKDQKKDILAKLSDAVIKNASHVFVQFHGVTVADITKVRRALRGAGVGYTVAKKTLIKKALDGGKIAGTMPALEGEVALAYGNDDMTAPAREVYAFQKKLDGKVSILGGVFEGQYKTKEEMMSIATIPSRQVLYAQFVNLINSPIQRFAVVIDAIAKSKTV